MNHAHATASSSSGRHTSASADGTNQPSAANESGSSAPSSKRKRSAQGCVVAENDVIVEELQKIRGKIRESSHLAGNYGRAIFSLQNHTEPITSAREAKQLRNIGNYIANQIQSILQKHQIRSRGDAPVPAATRTASASEPAARPPPPPPPYSASANEDSSRPPVATAPSAARRPYLPAEGKQPWYVLCTLKEQDADSAPRAVSISVLLSKMQAAGYDGNLAKLRVCITSLLNTHQIISKTSDGGIFLNDRGIQSAQLCIGTSRRPATQERVGQTPSVHVQVDTAGGSKAAYEAAHSVTAYQATSVIEERVRIRASEAVCIDLSDSDGDGYDSDTATIRATSMSPTRRPGGEPDAEPGYSLPPRPIGQNADPLGDLVRRGDEWEIVLLLDHREVLSRRNRDILERKLLEVNVTCEVRSLNVGDVQWVARRYRGFEAAEEFMLNVIVERKEVKDLSGSIIDRRYNEQKTRLRDSGMTHVIYLVEGSLTQQTTVRSSGLQTALCRTQVQNQFFVQQCQNADESVAFLRGVHMNLLAKLPAALTCRNREREPGRIPKLSSSTAPTVGDWKRQFCLPIRTYTDFNEQFRKKADFTVGEIYQMMLMQVHGLSSSRTVALAAAYPTFQHLAKAIARGEKLQDVRYGENQRRLGAKTHEFIKFLFESTDYERDPPSVNCGSGGGGVLE